MNEAVGRATEMGRPVLYVPGIADMDDIQTIASMNILSEVAKTAAHLTVFQRTPNFCAPLRNSPIDQETQHQIKASFFTPGHTAATYPASVEALAADGHEIGAEPALL